MTDVQFGVTIQTAPGRDPIAWSLAAQDAGFDFVSTADHPATGQPSYETWTLLSWIAARTTRIKVATKVLGVPLRPPAMTAKMAETLQRLSDGRLILGLGGGFSDEEISSLGLGAWTPGEKVDGLKDAINIMRGLWAEPEFTYAGARHHVTRARMQPKPAEPIPIWLGTFGPRALALTGRLADGWIPSLGVAPPEAVPAMRDRILAAADRVGRDPAQITCAYNMEVRIQPRPDESSDVVSGPPEAIAERLTGFVALGFTAMNFSVVGPGEDEQLQRVAAEVLPAVRQAVA
jgi:alkanesulfonate monooxygenase SsuD/methylene tetrahydromethanopterin reductase-like flavin-dependent oxidoreductase (luciferase family)